MRVRFQNYFILYFKRGSFLSRYYVTSLTKCTDLTTGQATLVLLTLLDNETFRLS